MLLSSLLISDVGLEDEIEGGHNWAFLTLDMLVRTSDGDTFPATVTFFARKSMSKDFTPAKFHMIFYYFIL